MPPLGLSSLKSVPKERSLKAVVAHLVIVLVRNQVCGILIPPRMVKEARELLTAQRHGLVLRP